MEITEALIQKFFSKNCTPEEAARVSAFLQSNPNVLDQYLKKTEWDKVEDKGEYPEVFWDEIWRNIQRQKKPSTRFSLNVKYAIAASMIALLGICGWLYISNERTVSKQQLAYVSKVVENNTLLTKNILLNDGTEIQLAPQSRISFKVPFQNNARNIELSGEAFFKVAKDKTKPFTVYTDQIATTALGTAFKVSSYSNKKNISVYLFEGKVVVKQRNSADSNYLLPGDNLIFDRQKLYSRVMHRSNEPLVNNETEIVAGQNRSTLVFKKALLSTVFNELAINYHTTINYSNQDLEELYYIGTINKTDSLENILSSIAKLNGLKLTRNNDGGYTIAK
ncbi:FecR family protein [Pedobacter sandarakinus]|uniref:FecR family protein n=1 Tax=Pedobacter sandarakinus TaxID=353156 RepID=UPI0022450884|nr:FecR family protein [Pedobacter sandarakinus]MCX2574592.1 FecR family protein [Pedobacter sandarakinus]